MMMKLFWEILWRCPLAALNAGYSWPTNSKSCLEHSSVGQPSFRKLTLDLEAGFGDVKGEGY